MAMAVHKKMKTGESVFVEEESIAPIYNLNADCLVKIFEYLSIDERLNIEKVCKRWREVSELAWNDMRVIEFTGLPPGYTDNRVSTRPRSFEITDYMAQILQRCGRYLNKLKLGNYCDPILLPVVARHCKNLTKLEILDASQYDDTRVMLVTQLEKLEFLEIKEIVQHFPRGFFQDLPHEHLTELHLRARTVGVTVYKRLPLLGGRETMEEATAFYNFSKLTALTLDSISFKGPMMDAINQMSNLTYLSLANCSAQGKLPDPRLLKNLEHLNVSKFPKVDNNLLFQISKNCEHLKYLNLSHSRYTVNDRGLLHLRKLLHLEELITSYTPITDVSLCRMHALRKLECDHSPVQSNGIISLMRHAPNLEVLNLAWTQVNLAVLARAAKTCRRRINNLKLEVTVSSHVVKGVDVPAILQQSPLLRIHVDERRYQ